MILVVIAYEEDIIIDGVHLTRHPFASFCLVQQLHNVWQKKPYHVSTSLDSVKGSYTMEDVQNSVDSDFLEAGRGTFQEGVGGWNMAAVSKV